LILDRRRKFRFALLPNRPWATHLQNKVKDWQGRYDLLFVPLLDSLRPGHQQLGVGKEDFEHVGDFWLKHFNATKLIFHDRRQLK
jgi:hypothetical protein